MGLSATTREQQLPNTTRTARKTDHRLHVPRANWSTPTFHSALHTATTLTSLRYRLECLQHGRNEGSEGRVQFVSSVKKVIEGFGGKKKKKKIKGFERKKKKKKKKK